MASWNYLLDSAGWLSDSRSLGLWVRSSSPDLWNSTNLELQTWLQLSARPRHDSPFVAVLVEICYHRRHQR